MHLEREGQRDPWHLPPPTHRGPLLPPWSHPRSPGVGKGVFSAAASDLPGYLTQDQSLVCPSGKWISDLRRCVPGWTVEVCSHGDLFLQNRSKVGPQGSEPLGMGTENESPEPDCQKQFQAAVSVIQNLPKNGEGTGTCTWGSRRVGSASDPCSLCRYAPAWAALGISSASCPCPAGWDPSPSLPIARVVFPLPPLSWSWG